MLELAERIALRKTGAGRRGVVPTRLRVATCRSRPRFDAATLINVLHFVPDNGRKGGPPARDIARRLRPGAVFVLFDLHGDPGSEEHERYMPAWRRYWKDPRHERGGDGRLRRAHPERGIHFAPPERVLELARDAGFTDPQRFFKGMLYGGWTFRRM